jgi:hypothetical protein
MPRIRDRVEDLLAAMAGPWLLASVAFMAKVALGVVWIPLALVGLLGLGAFHVLTFLHRKGEQSIAAAANFYHGRPTP